MSEYNNIAKPFRVFNGKVANKATKIFGGVASGLCDYDDIKYPHILDLNKAMSGEFWTEDEIRLNDDLRDYRQLLAERERYVYNVSSGVLTLLDSIANKFNFVMGYIATDPSVQQTIQQIGFFECLHDRSYQYLTSTMLNFDQKRQAFETPKTEPLLVKRNQPVIDLIQDFVDSASSSILGAKNVLDTEMIVKIFRAIIANLVLEGIYFTGAFVYFHSLARTNRMIGSNNMVCLIKEDETQHSVFWGEILKILVTENEFLNTDENYQWAKSFIMDAVELEKQWASHLFQGIDTFTIPEYNNYVEYLANIIVRNAGMDVLYPDNTVLKSNWIQTYGDKKGVVRPDFFQTNVIQYGHDGGDGFDL